MNDTERQEINAIAELIQKGQQLEEVLVASELAADAVSEIATNAVHEAINGRIETLAPAVIGEIVSEEQTKVEEITKLQDLRNSLLELHLSTDEIDDRLSLFNQEMASNEAVLLKYISLNGVIAATAPQEETEQLDLGQNYETETEPAGRLIQLGYGMHDERGAVLTIGARRVKLSGARHEQQTDYSAERMAAVAVLAELLPGNELSVSSLWSRMNLKLGVAEDHGFDRQTMNQVRSFITNLHYRNQPIFYHNAIRGIASAYGVNPELKYDVAFREDDEQITDFIRALVDKRSGLSAQQGSEDESGIPPTALHMPEQSLFEENTLEEVSSMTEVTPRLDETLMPNPLELHVFLTKLHSSINTLQGSYANIDPNSMIARLSEITDETLEYIEHGYTDEQKDFVVTDSAIEEVRRTVTEKIIALTEDNELLNDLLEGDVEQRLADVYGKSVGIGVLKLIETVLDMDDDEKRVMRELIDARPGMSVTLQEGSFTGATQVVSVDFSLIGAQIDESLLSGLQQTDAEELLISETDHVERVSSPSTEQDYQEPAQVLTVPAAAEAEKNSSSTKKLMRQKIGGVINQLNGAGFNPDSSFTLGQIEAVFGVRARDVVNAKENNLISENKGKDLTYEDIAIILAVNDGDADLRKIFQNGTLRKQFRKLLRQTVSELRES